MDTGVGQAMEGEADNTEGNNIYNLFIVQTRMLYE